VEQQTNDKIKDLIQPGVLNSASRLVLANAIYFKAAWKQPFNSKLTAPEKFQVDPQNAVNVPMMHANKRARFFKGDTFRALELPYEGNELAIVLLLPEKADGLADFEKQLTGANLKSWLAKLSDHQVNLAMPKFTLTSEFYLNKVLAAMGMPDAFSDAADFSGITSEAKLSISAVIHKAFINVDEHGTEAAASTAIAIGLTSAPPAAVFVADHPFVYLIRDNRTTAVLFMGRVMNPT
jgi:serpin B